jgi:hypothetical protein
VLPGHPGFCVDRGSTYVCIIDRFGGYGCPTNAEGSPPLKHKNATTDKRGVLRCDVPLAGTRPTPPLPWQRYPHINGWIEPWTKAGRLRAGLRLRGLDRGSCSRGSYETPAKTAGRCLPVDGSGIYDPCFARRGRWARGAVLACGTWPGATTFSRFVIART